MKGPFERARKVVAAWEAAHPRFMTNEAKMDLIREIQGAISEYGEDLARIANVDPRPRSEDRGPRVRRTKTPGATLVDEVAKKIR